MHSVFAVLLLFLLNLSVISNHHLLRFNLCPPPNVCTEISNCQNSNQDLTILGVKISCGFEGSFQKVCCPLSSMTTTSAPRVIRRDQDLIDHENFGLLPLDLCGVVSNRLRITSGASASPGEFPWMALIAYKAGNSTTQRDFKCGGTLITQRYVLTAAHCIDNSTILGVRLGEYNIMTEIDCDENGQNCAPPVQDFLIEKITVHAFYDPKTFANDIALIKLAAAANFSYENVRPICLPFDELIDVRLAGEKLTVAGWGATETGDKSIILHQVSVPVLATASCRTLYASIKPITAKQICAGGGGRDSCAGDSGGPLKRVDLVNAAPRYVQYGIVSFGPTRCGLSRRPGIYTNLQKYMKWLLDHLD